MAVQNELWSPHIVEGLFRGNEFIKLGKDVSEFVLAGRVVHIPNAGAPANVQRNRAVLPATITRRTDIDITYVLDEYTSDPIAVTDTEEIEVNYNKRKSVIDDNVANMSQVLGDNMLYNWSVNIPAAGKLLTSGADVSATAPGATGTRKALTDADIRAAQKYLNKQNVAKDGRYMILSSEYIDQLKASTQSNFWYQVIYDLRNGEMPKIHGFNLIERSQSLITTAANAVKLPEAAAVTTDNEGAFFFQKDAVEYGMGDIKVFENVDVAEWYGSVYSILARIGGRARHNDGKGVGMIVAAA